MAFTTTTSTSIVSSYCYYYSSFRLLLLVLTMTMTMTMTITMTRGAVVEVESNHAATATATATIDDTEDQDVVYRVLYPNREDYMIGILINPCGANGTHAHATTTATTTTTTTTFARGYDCCHHQFGRGEYGFMKYASSDPKEVAWSDTEALSHPIPASHDEVLHNLILVDEYGEQIIPHDASRRADDVTYVDETCRSLRDPHPSCLSFRRRAVASPYVPNCWDHNQTVDATLGCVMPPDDDDDDDDDGHDDGHDDAPQEDRQGRKSNHCMQVSYSQNAFLHICSRGSNDNDENDDNNDNDDDDDDDYDENDCGTFLEIHRRNGSPYHPEEMVLSSSTRPLTTLDTNGMVTTTLSLTYDNDPNRILCNYEETKIRVGTMVRIIIDSVSASGSGSVADDDVHDDVYVCCCPPKYHRTSGVGSYMCPIKPGTEGGPFADRVDTMAEKLERDRMLEDHYDDNDDNDNGDDTTSSSTTTTTTRNGGSPKCPHDKDEGRDTLQCRIQLNPGSQKNDDDDDDDNDNDDPNNNDNDIWKWIAGSTTPLYHSRECHPVVPVETTTEQNGSAGSSSSSSSSFLFTSPDLNGSYPNKCPLGRVFQACGSIGRGRSDSDSDSDSANNKKCQGDDAPFSFRNRVGKVVRIPNDHGAQGDDDGDDDNGDDNGDGGGGGGHQQDPNQDMYSVTFNDGRTSYEFPRHHLEIEQPSSNYEVWFVKRHVVVGGNEEHEDEDEHEHEYAHTRDRDRERDRDDRRSVPRKKKKKKRVRVVEKKKGFRVIWPLCTFDAKNDRYFPYAQKGEDGTLLTVLR